MVTYYTGPLYKDAEIDKLYIITGQEGACGDVQKEFINGEEVILFKNLKMKEFITDKEAAALKSLDKEYQQ
jgi:hypothetical protein